MPLTFRREKGKGLSAWWLVAAGLLLTGSAASPDVFAQMLRALVLPVAMEWTQPAWQSKVASAEAFAQVSPLRP